MVGYSKGWPGRSTKLPFGHVVLALALIFGPALSALAAETLTVLQKGRAFNPLTLNARVGDTVHIVNDDEFIHHVFIRSATFNFDSGEVDLGQFVDIKLSTAGTFAVLCAIHPKMHLELTVR